MDTKEVRDRIKQKAAETGVTNQIPDHRPRERRVRSYKSLIINIAALIGLFALVFVLQQVGTRHAEKSEPAETTTEAAQVTAAEITLEERSPAATRAKPTEEKIKNQEVAMVEIETTEEGAARPKAQAKIILKTKKKRENAKTATKPSKTVRHRTNYGQSWREDRLRSAELVDMLDGPNSQRSVQRPKRLNWADDVPMASTQATYSRIEETSLTPRTHAQTYATATPQEKPTYVAPSRRPAWDVNAGETR